MRERGVWVEREVCKMSLRFTKRKKVHILKTLDQRDLAYNSDDFPVPNWRICKKNSVMQAFILIGCIKSTFFLKSQYTRTCFASIPACGGLLLPELGNFHMEGTEY